MLICWLLPILAPFLGVCDPPPFDPWEEHRLLVEIAAQATGGEEQAQAVQDEPDPPPEDDPVPPEATEAPAGTQRDERTSIEVAKPEVPEPWASLADCESGDWLDGGAAFVEESARWDWAKPGTPTPSWGTTIHHGGLQFAPSTWDWVAGDLGILGTYPHAYDAPPSVQIEVAEEVQQRQGWGAWPVCSRKVGLR